MKTCDYGVIAALALTIALGPVGPAGAQPRPERPQAPRGERFGPGAAAGRFGPGFERVMSVLTDEQRNSLRQAMEGEREKMRELEGKIRVARSELFASSLSKTFDEESVRAKAMTAAKAEAELTVLRTKAFSMMKPALSVEQLKEVRASFPELDAGRPTPPRRGDRDENDLPSKDRVPPEPKPQK